MYAPNRASTYTRPELMEIKGEMNRFILTVEDFNTSLSNNKINKDIGDLDDIINQQLFDIYMTFVNLRE